MTADLLLLYSFRRCPYAMRARLALAASGQVCTLREIDLKSRPSQLYEISPKATVPVLQLPDGVVLEQSLAIMEWTLRNSDPERWLQSTHSDPQQVLAPLDFDPKTMPEFMVACDTEFKFHLDRYKYASRYPGTDATQHRSEAAKFLLRLQRCLLGQPFLSGRTFGLVDAAVAPFVRQFALADRAWFDDQEWPQLRKWLADFLQSNRFQKIMHKYPLWDPHSAPLRVDWQI